MDVEEMMKTIQQRDVLTDKIKSMMKKDVPELVQKIIDSGLTVRQIARKIKRSPLHVKNNLLAGYASEEDCLKILNLAKTVLF